MFTLAYKVTNLKDVCVQSKTVSWAAVTPKTDMAPLE